MTHLVAMRQRIKTVETIKKVTHAMRLISMSTHSRLRNKKEALDSYTAQIATLVETVYPYSNSKPLFQKNSQRKLVILIGSQKSLCGNFNSSLFGFFKKAEQTPDLSTDIIAVGKEAVHYCLKNNNAPINSYNNFSLSNFISIAREITEIILRPTGSSGYSSVSLYFNYPKSFFLQKPMHLLLLPIKTPESKSITQEEYIWEHTAEEVVTYALELMIAAQLEKALFNSLLAEQAARFIAMDSATRNAEELIQEMKIEYNKLRQMQITQGIISV